MKGNLERFQGGFSFPVQILGPEEVQDSREMQWLMSISIPHKLEQMGQQLSAESFDEGRRPDTFDVPWSQDSAAASSSLWVMSDGGNTEQERGYPVSSGTLSHGSVVINGAKELLSLLRILGEGYRLSSLYRYRDAVEIYLPQHKYNTGWVLSQVGRLYFELEKMKLSYLAQKLISIDRLSPQAWCAMGNCYSLQRDHETTLKNFQRAVQLGLRFAYAHTMCGHEYLMWSSSFATTTSRSLFKRRLPPRISIVQSRDHARLEVLKLEPYRFPFDREEDGWKKAKQILHSSFLTC